MQTMQLLLHPPKEDFIFYLSLFVSVFVYFAKWLKKLWTDFDEIFGGLGRSSSNSRLDFSGYPDHNPNAGFLDLHRDPNPGILKDSLFNKIIVILTDSQE